MKKISKYGVLIVLYSLSSFISQAQGNADKTVLVFYKSGCGPCEELLGQLPAVYQRMKDSGMRIIAISSDADIPSFMEHAQDFPWERSYCDLQGTQGVNFKSYGVIGTPTLFVIDKQGKIIEKPSGVDFIERWYEPPTE